MGADKKPKPMYMDEVDEGSGKVVRGARRSASTKEKPKISQHDGHTRKSKKPNSDSGYSTGQVPEEVDASSPEVQKAEAVSEKETKHERRKSSIKSSPKKSDRRERSASAHRDRERPELKIVSPKKEDPSHYGVSPSARTAPPVITQPIPMGPRAATSNAFTGRPVSYHAAYSASGYQAPPISNSAFWQQQAVVPTPSYPPPSPSYMRYAAQPDYFTARPPSRTLATRFELPARTSSAYGVREGRTQTPVDYKVAYHDDGYAAAEGASIRRSESASIRVPSRMRMSKAAQDAEDMPPPPRPILRRPITDGAYIDSGRQLYRSARGYSVDEYDHDESVPRSPSSRPSNRPNANRNSVSYDLGGSDRIRVEPANSGRRRQSYYGPSVSTDSYGPSTGSSELDAKIRDAMNHQEDVGGPTVPLTADMLRRQQRHTGSSRSTKSSGSRDESDYRRSATTRTTRSVQTPEDENVTIKVTGQARVVVGGAQIDCQEGGEIKIKRRESLRMGSDRSNSEYDGHGRLEERRSRADRHAGRSRMSSQHDYQRSGAPAGNFF